MSRERTSAGLATARAEGRISAGGGRSSMLGKRKEIAESVISNRKSRAEMVRLCNMARTQRYVRVTRRKVATRQLDVPNISGA
jgi:hypothetical protein